MALQYLFTLYTACKSKIGLKAHDKPVDEKPVELVGEILLEFLDVMRPGSESEMQQKGRGSRWFRPHTLAKLPLLALGGAHVARRLRVFHYRRQRLQ